MKLTMRIDPKDFNRYIPRIGCRRTACHKTSSAIRITHLPTGVVVTCQDQRSQFRIKTGHGSLALEAASDGGAGKADAIASERKARLARRPTNWRTHNFPQSRVTDHRIGQRCINWNAFFWEIWMRSLKRYSWQSIRRRSRVRSDE